MDLSINIVGTGFYDTLTVNSLNSLVLQTRKVTMKRIVFQFSISQICEIFILFLFFYQPNNSDTGND